MVTEPEIQVKRAYRGRAGDEGEAQGSSDRRVVVLFSWDASELKLLFLNKC